MKAASVAISPSAAESGASVVGEFVKGWIAACEEYRRRERSELIEGAPTKEREDAFRQELKWLLRSARHLLSLVTDPDYPFSEYADDFAWRVQQLEDSWKSLNNPLGE